MEIGLVQKIDIDEEMQQAYLDYAMSVIVARALPDARDGLKPVHRRILYAMYDMGLRPDSAYKKSARIVGEVLGKYHPHGDMAVYEAMARMAQDFSMRYMLVDGQGNFGSVDGDPPAAMRYTEARLQRISIDMLRDINKDTVDFEDNFDGTLTEPRVLPSAIPNLLVNGATGIAVGMSTSIPPHNLGEVVDALRYMLDNWTRLDDVSVEDLMQYIQGPDFPTGGVIIQEAHGETLASSYGTGRGRVTLQARAHLEEMDRGRSRIIITELPYMTNKSGLIERIASLVREERLDGISDLRDESDRSGMRIVIELSRGADPEALLRDLYKTTPMQSTFSIIMLALVDGEPRMLSLKQALRVYLDHRLEIVRRRSEYDLNKARQRAHILEGYRVALKNLDEVISIIRKAPDADTARTRLMKRFKLTEIQAQAILDLQLRRLAALERKKIEEEYKEILALIKELESLLKSPKKMRQVVSDELLAVKEAFGDPRRTQIVHLREGEKKVSLLTATDLAPEKDVWVSVSAEGLISRSPDEKMPRLSGNEAPVQIVAGHTHDLLYLVTERGEAASIALHNLPETDKPAQGIHFSKVSPLREGDNLVALFALPRNSRVEDWYVLSVSRLGMVKKSALSELPGASANTFTLTRVNEGDRLGWVRITNGQAEVFLVTRNGMAIRFKEEEVRPMGLVAAGVMGIKLQPGDEIAGMDLLPHPGEVFLIASDATAKRVEVSQYPVQGRYGQGVITWKLEKNISVVGTAIGKGTTRGIVYLDKLAPKSIRLDDAGLFSRTARGQSIQDLKKGDRVLAFTVPQEAVRPGGAGPEVTGSGGPPPPEVEPNGRQPKQSSARTTVKKSTAAAEKKPGSAKTASGKASAKASTGKAAAAKKVSAKAAVTKTIGGKTGSKTKASVEKTARAKTGPAKASATKTAKAEAPTAGRKRSAASPPAVQDAPVSKSRSTRSKAAPPTEEAPAAKTRSTRSKTASPAEEAPAAKKRSTRSKVNPPAEDTPATTKRSTRSKAAPPEEKAATKSRSTTRGSSAAKKGK